jgi:hypothetical protein
VEGVGAAKDDEEDEEWEDEEWEDEEDKEEEAEVVRARDEVVEEWMTELAGLAAPVDICAPVNKYYPFYGGLRISIEEA